ncbi:MAG: SPASM domain-containing protein [Candidatus Brocadia sp.]|nr:SPASM domain-containing protein [Candidatus Brocadia sp.]
MGGTMKKINKVFFLLISKKKTLKQKGNLALAYIQFIARSSYLLSYPVKMRLDPSNYCNIHCELCPTGTKAEGRTQGFMSFSTFKKIVDECGAYLWEIGLFNWGEPLLNKEIFKMVKYAKGRKIDVNISTNLNYFNDDICVKLIESGLNKLIISLHGASQESVTRYQKGCNFQSVIKNMEKIVSMRERLESKTPFIQWRFLVNRYNENEIEKAMELSKNLKVDKLELGQFRCDMGKEILLTKEEQHKNVEHWLPKNKKISRHVYPKVEGKEVKNICKLMWFESNIHPNGSISPCCAVWDEQFDFGNINVSSFRKIWNGEKYKNARMISSRNRVAVEREKGHVCNICIKNGGLFT